jgi:hypothetical protein
LVVVKLSNKRRLYFTVDSQDYYHHEHFRDFFQAAFWWR